MIKGKMLSLYNFVFLKGESRTYHYAGPITIQDLNEHYVTNYYDL